MKRNKRRDNLVEQTLETLVYEMNRLNEELMRKNDALMAHLDALDSAVYQDIMKLHEQKAGHMVEYTILTMQE